MNQPQQTMPPPPAPPRQGMGIVAKLALVGVALFVAVAAWGWRLSTRNMPQAVEAARQVGCANMARNGDFLAIESFGADRCADGIGLAAFELGFSSGDVGRAFDGSGQPVLSDRWQMRAIPIPGGVRVVFSPR